MSVECLELPIESVRHPGQFLAWQFHQQLGEASSAEAIWSTQQVLTHGELRQRTAAWVACLAPLGERYGGSPVCGVYAGDTYENLFLGIGLLLAGLTQTILPLHSPEEELRRLIESYGVDLVLADRPLPESLEFGRITVLRDGIHAWGRHTPNHAPTVSATAGCADWGTLLARPAHLTLTSGTTTGIPRVNRVSFLSVLASLQRSNWPTGGRTLASLSLQYGSGRLWAMRILLSGATLCVNPGFSPRQLASLAGRAEADAMGVGNPFLLRILEENLGSLFPSGLIFISGSDRVPAPLRRRFQQTFGPRLTIFYATSQTGPLTRLPPEELLEHDGEGIGRLLPNVAFDWLEPEEKLQRDQEIAEVVVHKQWVVRMHHRTQGDLQFSESVKAFRPGDLLRRWPDRSFSFVGRANDVFLFRSVLISPHEIEDLLNAAPTVREAVAFGAHSSVYGAVPMAVVRLREGVDPGPECQRLRRVCQAAMGFRAPKLIRPLEEIPRTSTGKPLRRLLAERYALA